MEAPPQQQVAKLKVATLQAAKLNATKLELETELPPASVPTLETAKQAM